MNLAGRLRRLVTRRWLWLRHRVLGRRYRHLVLESLDGVPLVVMPEVFNPVLFRTGWFLAGSLPPASSSGGGRALDVGCGAGAASVFAARAGYRVTAVDINEEAVRCTRINALLNDAEERVDVRHGDLFAPVAGERFDLVLFNPPFYRGAPRDRLDRAWRSPDVFERFAAGLGHVLTPSGQALILLSTEGDCGELIAVLEDRGFVLREVVSRDFGNEVMTLHSARPRQLPAEPDLRLFEEALPDRGQSHQ